MVFSIIVPVYNSEKYLAQCIESVLSQTYPDFELILIDDESTDSSYAICQNYAAKDSRVRVIHKQNGGTSSARNAGLEVATGQYTTFIDNDDYWNDPEALSILAAQLKESHADALFYNSVSYYQNTDSFASIKDSCSRDHLLSLSTEEALKELLKNQLLFRAVWTKVVKTSLIREHHIYFPKGMRNEDTDWTATLLSHITSLDYCEKTFYVYRKGTGNAQTDTAPNFKIITDLAKILKNNADAAQALSPERREVLYHYLAYPYAVWMAQIRSCSFKDPAVKKEFSYMKKYAYLLKYNLDPSVRLVSRVYRFAGFRITSRLLNYYLYHRK